MVRKYSDRISITVRPDFCILLAALILMVPLKWVLAWSVATVVHELFHYGVIRICRIPVCSLTITTRGILMETAPMPYLAEFFCALAGPVGALLLLFWGRWFPEVAVCAYVQSLYNLLPLYPLDGGRAVRSLLLQCLSESTAERVSGWFSFGILIVLCCLGFYASCFLKLGPVPLLAAVLLFFRHKRVKNSLQRWQTASTI